VVRHRRSFRDAVCVSMTALPSGGGIYSRSERGLDVDG
jgi:hypothetical protein